MAITRTQVHAQTSGDGHGTGVFTTTSFTPGSGVPLEIIVFAFSNSNDTLAGSDVTVTDSMGPLTYSVNKQTTDTESDGWGYAIKSVRTSNTTGGGSMTVSVDAGAFNITNYRVEVYTLSGHDTGSPIGASGLSTDVDGDGAGSITLDATPASSSIVVGLAITAHDSTVGTIDPGADFTEVTDVARSGWWNFHHQTRTGSTSTTVAWADLNNGGLTPLGSAMMAYEIKAASASYTPRGTLLGAG